eukprot:6213798-Pleurochrysis_carterae.AAC.3
MEVRTTAAAAISARSVARDPRKHTIHPGSRDVGCSIVYCVYRYPLRGATAAAARGSAKDKDDAAAVQTLQSDLRRWTSSSRLHLVNVPTISPKFRCDRPARRHRPWVGHPLPLSSVTWQFLSFRDKCKDKRAAI